MNRFRILIVLPLLLLAVLPAAAEDPYLAVDLSVDYPLLGFATMMKPSPDSAVFAGDYREIEKIGIRLLLEEARWIFSGMIYGYRFQYVPGSAAEGIEDVFELEPVYQIPEGDSAMKVQETAGDTERLSVRFLYWTDDRQAGRIRQSRGGDFCSVGGDGFAPMMEEGARIASMKDGVKQALREDLRQKVYNRPREVTGLVFFDGPPVLSVLSGQYRCRVRIRYRVDELRGYPLSR